MKNGNYKVKVLGRMGSLLSAGVLIAAPIVLTQTLGTNHLDTNTTVTEPASPSTTVSDDGPSLSATDSESVVDNSETVDESESTIAVGEKFWVPYAYGSGEIEYTVLTEKTDTANATVCISGFRNHESKVDLVIKTTISHNNINYSLTSINDDVFSNNSYLTSLIITSVYSGSTSLKAISSGAFTGCSKLTSVTICQGVERIEKSAFKDCLALKTVKLPSSLIEIATGAFNNCNSLQKIELPSNLQIIGPLAFDHCTSLKSVIIPKKVTSIGDFAFDVCTNLTNVYMPEVPPKTIGKKIFGDMVFGINQNDPKMFLPSTNSTKSYNNLNTSYWPTSYRTYTVKVPSDPVTLDIIGDSLIEVNVGSKNVVKAYYATFFPYDCQYATADWSISKQPPSTKISINNYSGVLTVPSNLPVGTHEITIKAVCPSSPKGEIAVYKDIVIVVKGVLVESIDIIGEQTITCSYGSKIIYCYDCCILPTNATNKKFLVYLTGDTSNGEITVDFNWVGDIGKKIIVYFSKNVSVGVHDFTINVAAVDGSLVSNDFDVICKVLPLEGERVLIEGDDYFTTIYGTPITAAFTFREDPAYAIFTDILYGLDELSSIYQKYITIDATTGILSVASDTPVGIAHFNVWINAKNSAGTIKNSKMGVDVHVILPSDLKISINGADFVETPYGTATNKSYTVAFIPSVSPTPTVFFYLDDNPSPDTIKISNNGILTVDKATPINTYYCTIVAITDTKPQISAEKSIIINVTAPKSMSITVSGDDTIVTPFGTSTTSNFTAKILPIQASQMVKWSLENESFPGSISINQSGKLTVPNDAKIGKYMCTVVATATDGSEISAKKNIVIEVIPPVAKTIAIAGETLITAVFGTVINQKYTATINPSGASQTVTWNLTNLRPGNQATIDPTTGVVNVPTDQPVGQHICTVNCTSQDGTNITASCDITIIISPPTAVNIVISGTNVIKTSFGTSASATYSAKVTPIQASQNVKWSITGDTAEGKITIDSFGKVNVANNTPIKDYSLIITATTMDGSNQKATSDLVVSVTTNAASEVTISGKEEIITPYGTLANTTYKAQVDPVGSSQAVTWSVTGNTANGKICIDSLTGNLTVADNTPMGTYVCTIIATSTSDIQKQGTQTIVVTVSSPPVEKVEIIGPSEINVTVSKGGSEQYTASVAPVEASQELMWSVKVISGDISASIDATGKLMISSDTPIGAYKLLVCAQPLKADSNITSEKTVNVNITAASPAKIVIDGNENIVTQQGIVTSKQYNAVVGPVGSPQAVKWSLQGDTANNKIKINEITGKLSISPDVTVGTHLCDVVVVTDNANLKETKAVAIYVAKPAATSVDINGKDQISATYGYETTEIYTAIVTPSGALQNVIWSLTGETDDGQITIDSGGKLVINAGVLEDEHKCNVIATTTGISPVTYTKPITINVEPLAPKKIEIVGDSTIDTTFSNGTSVNYIAKLLPVSDVKWSLSGNTAAGKITIKRLINNISELMVETNTPVGDYTCTITAIGTSGTDEIVANKNVTIHVIDDQKPQPPGKDNTLAITIGVSVGVAVLVGAVTAATVISLDKNKKMKV